MDFLTAKNEACITFLQMYASDPTKFIQGVFITILLLKVVVAKSIDIKIF